MIQIVVIFIILIIVATLKIEININNLDVFYFKKKFYINNIDINLKLKLFGIMPIIIKKIKKKNININNFEYEYKRFENGKMFKILKTIWRKRKKIEILHPKVKLMDLKVGVGSEFMPLTIISIPIISFIISFVINKYLEIDKENIIYRIIPRYNSNNFDIILNMNINIDVKNIILLLINTRKMA